MIEGNLAYDYVDAIPWSKNPAFAFSNDTEAYMEAFRNAVDKVPIKGAQISFSDNTWDFNPYFDGINNASYKIIFEDCPAELLDYSKFFILFKIMGKTKISTANVRYTTAMSIIKAIFDNTRHTSIHVVTTDDIKKEIDSRNLYSSTKHNAYEGIYQYYYFLKNNYKLDLPVDIEELKKLGIAAKVADKQDDTKFPDIPAEFFNKIFTTAVRIMRDKKAEYNRRATACAIIMLSELGLRIADLMAVRTDSIHSKKLANGVPVNYIHYIARKPSKPHSTALEFDMYCDAYCTEAFNTLLKIRKQCAFKDEPYLYVLDAVARSKNDYPIPNHRFNAELKHFLFNELYDTCLQDWDGIKKSKYVFTNPDTKQLDSVQISVPDTRQFRVHCCTRLYEQGVPLVYIQRYMSHLSEYMLGYYVRPKDTYQENIAYSEKVIKEIAGDDITPIGLLGNDIKENIQKFIADNNFNVQTDIDAIMKALGDKVIIRGKTGGVCIKTSLMPCAQDARTNEMMCAYNICPNLFHFYYMADISYLNFMTMQETYAVNKANGQTKAAQKELHKIKDVLRRRLIPELDELDKEISRKGTDVILADYPSLRDIVDNRNSVRKEIEQWMTKE